MATASRHESRTVLCLDDGKRTEVVSFKVTPRMSADLDRLAKADDRTLSDFLYSRTRRCLYGDVMRLELVEQMPTSDKVNLG